MVSSHSRDILQRVTNCNSELNIVLKNILLVFFIIERLFLLAVVLGKGNECPKYYLKKIVFHEQFEDGNLCVSISLQALRV